MSSSNKNSPPLEVGLPSESDIPTTDASPTIGHNDSELLDPKGLSRIDQAIEASLRRHPEVLNDLTRISLHQVGNGERNISIRVQPLSDEPSIVCRIPIVPLSKSQSPSRIKQEYEVLSKLPPGVAPRAHYLDENDPDKPILVEEYIHDAEPLSSSNYSKKSVASLAIKLAGVHSIKSSASRRIDLEDFFTGLRLKTWLKTLEDTPSKTLRDTVEHKTLQVIERAQPLLFDEIPSRTLIHNDLTPDNVLVTPTDEVRLIDFEFAAAYDPALEVARLMLPPPLPNDGLPGDIAINPEYEEHFVSTYDTVSSDDPTRRDRIRIGKFIHIARTVISYSGVIETNSAERFRMSPTATLNARDELLEIFESSTPL